MAAARILLVEDRDSLRRLLARALADDGYEVASAATGGDAVRLLGERQFDLVLTDLKLPDRSGLEVLAASRQAQPRVPVVVLTGYGSVGAAVEAMKLGAYDFLEKPLELPDLARLVARALAGEDLGVPGDGSAPPEAQAQREQDGHGRGARAAAGAGAARHGSEGSGGSDDAVFQPPGAPPIVGRHPRLRAALRLLERVAPTESTVLLTGESGTGKELFARALHALSARRRGPLVAVNCAAIPEALLENELFGHEKGSFTGADRRQPGRFELAAGGTLLLDEIAEIPLPIQAKVLRVLEERTFERVGGGRTLHADLRLVAATNRDLQRMVEDGRFRSDLFFRLAVFPIELPPLRERSSDVPRLARHLVAGIARRHQLPVPVLAAGATEVLAAQLWPGNVRELANLLERAVILGDGPELSPADLQSLLGSSAAPPPIAEAERDRLRQALIDSAGDKRRAADRLGISYRALLKKVKEHDLEGVPKYRF
ncbi:MAG TPA: sigma-54 dependent transcriptional regulator [Thermoanaerobaculia bacterium]|jgi:DNA-binding NtrC family response regulator|nr:sigma-54 dependent transcriptional regulator [Thermoanaerobaculia bacterium]